MATDVFVSVGRACTTTQEAFIQEVENILRRNGISPRAVGRSDFSSKQPLKFIQELMGQCRGTVIIAFERLYVADGEEKRGSQNPKPVRNEILPTVWNQIEAGMAYVLGQPLLVIMEEGSRHEGLLEEGKDWYVLKVKIAPDSTRSSEFQGVLDDWIRRVKAHEAELLRKEQELPKGFDFSKLSLRELTVMLTPAQLWKIGGAIIILATAAFTLGRYAARWFGS